jgi:hypothetical protein
MPVSYKNVEQTEEYEDDKNEFYDQLEKSPVWTPVWLKWNALLGFSVVYILCCVALAVLRFQASVHDGFDIPSPSDRYVYAWTYGPTAVLVFFTSAWKQVDIFCRLAGPWRSLRSGRDNSYTALCEDYITPMTHSVIYRACKRKQWPILIGASGQVLLQLAVCGYNKTKLGVFAVY